MKIVHLCLGNPYIDNYSYQENMLTKYHVKMGHEVTVIASMVSFDKNGKYCLLDEEVTRMDNDGYKVIRIDFKGRGTIFYKYNKFFRHFNNFYKLLEQEKPDIIFCHNITFGDTSVVVEYLKKHKNVKLFADNHADYINSGRNFISKQFLHKIIWRHYGKKLEPYLERCYGVTPLRCDYLADIYKIKKSVIKFLPMGIDDDAIPQNPDEIRKEIEKTHNIPHDAFIIATGGKIDKLKNIHHLINAVIKENNPKIHLIVFGNVAIEMQDTMESLFKNERVHRAGWCNNEQVMRILSAADLCFFPGTHSVLWEQAVGLGKPCVFKEWYKMTHVNINGNCIFVKGENEEELQKVIRDLIGTDLYKEIHHKANIAAKEFRYSEFAKKAIEL